MVKVVLARPVRYPFGFDNVCRMGSVLDVSDEDEAKLREMGVLVEDAPEPETAESDDPTPVIPVEEPAGEATSKKFGPLPKKTQGINVWREYARVNEIDVRGLSEKPELMGHIIKVVNR